MPHAPLSDEALLAQLASLCLEGRRLVARVIEHLIAVEDRGLHLRAACDSMWSFCTQRLGMSHGETSRRLHAAKLVRRFPSLLGRIERGEIHLSSLKILGRFLDASNLDALLEAARGKSKLEVQELVARLFPRPDAPEIVIEQTTSPLHASSRTQADPASLPCSSTQTAEARPSPGAPLRNARIEPLSGTTYLVQMTLSKAGWDDLQRVKELMSHRLPNGSTVEIVEAALKHLRERLEKERLGKSSRPRAQRRSSKPGHIDQATRREVFERDGVRCAFVDAEGRRCTSRTRLELDHIVPRARGGSDEASNLRVTCRAHNLHLAEEAFGKDFVAEKIRGRQQHTASAKATASLLPATVAGDPARGDEGASASASATVSTPPEIFELAARGLVNMGFAKHDVKRALDIVCARRAGEVARVETLVRDAIQALT
ncbi:MAG: HNH endonuclease [Deltaproteobacteria bacterium]|nr:HNH endonuclease [Deltaproteobacteria bacterium]